jgi:hypothetical protein
MNQELLSDPRAVKIQTIAKGVGTVAVVGVASAAVIVIGASLITASVIAVVGLVMINFVVPVTARSVALWRISTMTKLTEAFSEETIREDEKKEGDRIKMLEQQYMTSRAELEGAQEELEKQISHATSEEKDMLKAQVASLQTVIDDAEDTLKQRKVDFTELQRVNKLYIALNRSANAMQKAHGAVRNPEELQRIEIARTSIKNKMREAMAGKTIESMNLAMNKAPTLIEEAKSNMTLSSSRRKKETVNV